jgi:hypothetical protein
MNTDRVRRGIHAPVVRLNLKQRRGNEPGKHPRQGDPSGGASCQASWFPQATDSTVVVAAISSQEE